MEHLNYEEFVRELEADPRTLVRVERSRPHAVVLRFDDPANMNALSGPLTVQLRRALADELLVVQVLHGNLRGDQATRTGANQSAVARALWPRY